MMSSTTPSAKYSCSGSPLMFVNGRTAMEGLSGSGSALETLGAPRAPTRAKPHRPGEVLDLLLARLSKRRSILPSTSS